MEETLESSNESLIWMLSILSEFKRATSDDDWIDALSLKRGLWSGDNEVVVWKNCSDTGILWSGWLKWEKNDDSYRCNGSYVSHKWTMIHYNSE